MPLGYQWAGVMVVAFSQRAGWNSRLLPHHMSDAVVSGPWTQAATSQCLHVLSMARLLSSPEI